MSVSLSGIQAIPDQQETVDHVIESPLIEYFKHLLDQPSTPEPMTAKDRTSEDSTLRSITSAAKDNVFVPASTAPMTIEDYIRLTSLFSLKMTQKKTAVAVLSPITIKLLAASVIVIGFFVGILFYLLRKSFQKMYDVEQPPVQMSKLVETRH